MMPMQKLKRTAQPSLKSRLSQKPAAPKKRERVTPAQEGGKEQTNLRSLRKQPEKTNLVFSSWIPNRRRKSLQKKRSDGIKKIAR